MFTFSKPSAFHFCKKVDFIVAENENEFALSRVHISHLNFTRNFPIPTGESIVNAPQRERERELLHSCHHLAYKYYDFTALSFHRFNKNGFSNKQFHLSHHALDALFNKFLLSFISFSPAHHLAQFNFAINHVARVVAAIGFIKLGLLGGDSITEKRMRLHKCGAGQRDAKKEAA